MNYNLIKDILSLMEDFEAEILKNEAYSPDLEGFKLWMGNTFKPQNNEVQPAWEGKAIGRTSESVIASLVVHMNRFGKSYFKSAIYGSEFSTQEDVIYLIVLKFSKNMAKMDLIKKNVHDKPTGMQIINRLINKGWVSQTDSDSDKRSKILNITSTGLEALDGIMLKVRAATHIVSGDLAESEKLELIRLLNKLHDFHQRIYDKNIEPEKLLSEALLYSEN
ncbi:MAG: MarR family transcriptional regulator [Flavobacterium sp.]|jgi:hypothetical protein|nr:MarR family transcriptional regulator [Flavobacterium sp.]